MTTRVTHGFDRLDSRQRPQPPHAPRGAGLYSEVVWDRSWLTSAPGKRSVATPSTSTPSPDE